MTATSPALYFTFSRWIHADLAATRDVGRERTVPKLAQTATANLVSLPIVPKRMNIDIDPATM